MALLTLPSRSVFPLVVSWSGRLTTTYRRSLASWRSGSLRSQWNRAFALPVLIIFISGVASIVGNQVLVAASQRSALRVTTEATVSAQLRNSLVAEYIAIASPLTSAQSAAVAVDVARIRTEYARALATERSPAAAALLRRSQAIWQVIPDTAGPTPALVSVEVRGAAVIKEGPVALGLLDQASAAARVGVRDDLTRASRHNREVLVVLALLELVAIFLAVRLARRLSSQVLQPVAWLRDSANRLAAGDYDHRVVLNRQDELGDLADSFNVMADAISGSQRSLSKEATTDSLSGVANRGAFRSKLAAGLLVPDRRPGCQAVLFIDLDDFKDVNDMLGHSAGDELLRTVAARLLAEVRPSDTVARIGGDEFAVLLDNVADPQSAMNVAARIVGALSQPVPIGSTWAQIGASVGVAVRRADSTLNQLMHDADVAMYTAKSKGKNRAEQYDSELDEQASLRHQLKSDLADAVRLGQFVLDYQPVVDLTTGAIVGAEALVRWQHPTRGLLPPYAFIELAESTGAILELGAWVLQTAARQLRSWQQRYALPALWVSVNVSVRQLDAPGFAAHVREVLGQTGLNPARLTLEVTESVLADPAGLAATALTELRHTGCLVALDDFGTGYSSIGYLRQLPIDAIKVDRSFVSGTYAGGPENSLLEAIVAMAQHLGLGVIPEGIEDMDQLTRLRDMGCRIGQGFLMSRPLTVSAFDELLVSPLPMPQITLNPAPSQAGERPEDYLTR